MNGNDGARCGYCERRCEIAENRTGFCGMYTVTEGALKERFSHSWSFCGTLPIEANPFYHVEPGMRCLVVGTAGCNFRCRYCSNAYTAKEDSEIQKKLTYHLSPGQLIRTAQVLGCHSIVFNSNEPTVSIPSLLDLSREAKRAALPMGCLTNGYTTVESTEILLSVFAFFNVSLKGLSPGFNQTYIGIDSCEPVLRNIRRLAQDRHVEVTTPIIEGVNDLEIDAIANFLAEVDQEIPWHVFRLLPEDEMKDARYPDVHAIEEALRAARKKLCHVYFHNFVGSEWVDTICPDCGSPLIERFSLGCGGDKLKSVLCLDGSCRECGRKIRLWGKDTWMGTLGKERHEHSDS